LKRYKYVGKERDNETGLYYYGARYYADWIARFVSVDPLQHKYPHYTPYQYAGNKPVTFIDLDGMEEAKPKLLPVLNEEMPNYIPPADHTKYKKPIIHPVTGQSYPSRIKQASLGLLNVLAGLSIAVTGASIAATTSMTIAGAVGGVAMMISGLSQMAIGVTQIVDAVSSKEKHIPDVSGINEMAGALISEKTGNPIYQAAGGALDIVESVGFFKVGIIPVKTNYQKLKEVTPIKNINDKIIFTRNSLELGSDIITIGDNSLSLFDYLIYKSFETENKNGQTVITIDTHTQYHKISEGETLSSIAELYGVSVDEIVQMNNIKNPNLIYAGDELKVIDEKRITVTNIKDE
jgi:RHS repeat-associated protein